MTDPVEDQDRTHRRDATLDLTDRALARRALDGRRGLVAGSSDAVGVPGGPGPVDLAAELAEDLLGEDRQRWRHTQAVASRAGQAVGVVPREHGSALLAAAWLHDIGYAAGVRRTGFHPLDGARYLSELGWPPLVAGLVA